MGRRTEQVNVELADYRWPDDEPREHRVDLIDPESMSTLASMTPDGAAALAGQLLVAAMRGRRLDHPPRVHYDSGR